MSLAKAGANVMIGCGLAVATQLMALPLHDLRLSAASNLGLGTIFRVVSLARSYVIRRAFERLGRPRSSRNMGRG
jgi:hypothetical protein